MTRTNREVYHILRTDLTCVCVWMEKLRVCVCLLGGGEGRGPRGCVCIVLGMAASVGVGIAGVGLCLCKRFRYVCVCLCACVYVCSSWVVGVSSSESYMPSLLWRKEAPVEKKKRLSQWLFGVIHAIKTTCSIVKLTWLVLG